MKTISLRQLLRDPLKVKHWTCAGHTVHVTDNGRPLWLIQAAVATQDDEKRQREIDVLLDEVLCEPRSRFSAARLLLESRR